MPKSGDLRYRIEMAYQSSTKARKYKIYVRYECNNKKIHSIYNLLKTPGLVNTHHPVRHVTTLVPFEPHARLLFGLI